MEINELMKQAQQMSKKLEQANEELTARVFEGSASNGLVNVKVNGEHKLLSVEIDPSIFNSDDREMVQDLVMIATNEAIEKADNAKKDKFGSMASALGLPNM